VQNLVSLREFGTAKIRTLANRTTQTLNERFRDLCREIIVPESRADNSERKPAIYENRTETSEEPEPEQIGETQAARRENKWPAVQIKPRLEEKAGGTEQRRTANTARKGETSQISPAGAGTPHQQTRTAETRTQTRGFDPRKHTPYVREHKETPNTSLAAAGAAAAAGERDWGWIRVPHHVQCRRGLRRARRGHVPSNRDGVRGAAHRIGVLYSSAGAGFYNRRCTPSSLRARRLALQINHLGRPNRREIAGNEGSCEI